MQAISRRKTSICKVGPVNIGSDFPVAMQSMCSTRTENVRETVEQIFRLEEAGCQLIRIAIPNMECAEKIPEIKLNIHIPIVADIHFDYRLALKAIKMGADKIRINPGNIGSEERVALIIKTAKKAGIAMRLGVNAGSLEQHLWDKYGRPSPEALIESALNWIKIFEKYDFTNFVIAVKSSDVQETVAAYEMLAEKCNYPFHLGITEAGIPPYGSIKSSIGIGALLLKGIGDTIRVSITDDPVEEIKVCKMILKSLRLYNAEPEVIGCPTCGRIEVDLMKLSREIEAELIRIGKPIKVSLMGCCVNGPGEAREADWGIMGGRKQAAIFRRGKILKWVAEDKVVKEFIQMVEDVR